MSDEARELVVLEMMAVTATALREGRSAGHAISAVLGEAMDADAAAWVAIDEHGHAEVLGAWPHADIAERLANQVAKSGWPPPADAPVPVEGAESTKIMVLVPRPADGSATFPGTRALVIRRGRGLSSDDLALGARALPALRLMLVQVVAASEQRRHDERRRSQALRFGLTERELQVLDLLVQGMLATSIAARLDLSPRTVHKHLGNIYEKLGVHDRLVAASIAQRYDLVNDPASDGTATERWR